MIKHEEMAALVALFNAGRYSELEIRASSLLKQHPDSGFAWKVLSVACQAQGKDALHALHMAAQLLPHDVEAQNNLGIVLRQLGKTQDAIACHRHALRINPQSAVSHFNLANVLQDAGELAQAVASFRTALAMQPEFSEAWNNLGAALDDLLQHEEAQACFYRALQYNPEYAQAHTNLGMALHHAGQTDYALISLRRAIQINPALVEAHNNLANILRERGQTDQALAALRLALHLAPESAALHGNLGNILRDMKQFVEAEKSFRLALQFDPALPEAYSNLGNVLRDQGRREEALACFLTARKIDPQSAQVHSNLGNALQDLRRFHEAAESFRQAIALQPDFAFAYNNLGNSLRDLGQFEAARESFLRAQQIDPHYPEAHVNHAFLLLQLGEFAHGWREYEYRWQVGDIPLARQFGQTLWLGDADLRGKSILLYAEQGFGDTLQFVRYAPLIAQRGAHVYLHVPPALQSLLQTCPGVVAVFSNDAILPPIDYRCPLMSLPLACRTMLETIPAVIPYLAPSTARIAHWASRLHESLPANAALGLPKLRVGLVWAGEPRKHRPFAHVIDMQRSLHFSQLLPLLALADIDFVSLQLGVEARSELQGNQQVLDLTYDIRDFEDTAALIANLDLVISVDTAVAHLTGATGKPLWLLNRHNTCWRWMNEREDSPWYPSARIFRQAVLGDWNGVIDDVKHALMQWER